MKVGGAFKSPMRGEMEGSRTGQEELQTAAQSRKSGSNGTLLWVTTAHLWDSGHA